MVKLTDSIAMEPESQGRPPLYPWREMEVGQSFGCRRKAGSMRPSAYRQGKRLDRQFAVRSARGGCRVWRTR